MAVEPISKRLSDESGADAPRQGPYRVVMVSVRCTHYYIAGASGCFDLDQPPPDGIGALYGSIESAQSEVRRDCAGVTSLWQFRIIDRTGACVSTGFRVSAATIRWQNPPAV